MLFCVPATHFSGTDEEEKRLSRLTLYGRNSQDVNIRGGWDRGGGWVRKVFAAQMTELGSEPQCPCKSWAHWHMPAFLVPGLKTQADLWSSLVHQPNRNQ